MPVCPTCNSEFRVRKGKRFCSQHCRWAYHNSKRISARQALITMAKAVLQGEGYEINRKAGG